MNLILKINYLVLLITGIFLTSCTKEDTDDTENIPVISELLGRPTKTSVSINVLSNNKTLIYWEFGTAPGSYTSNTLTYTLEQDVPSESVIDNLPSGTQLFYRARFKSDGSKGDYLAGTEHSFVTARSAGSSFRFAIEADPHLDTNSDTAAYSLTLRNIASEDPDFLIDLGDTFMSEKLPSPITQADITGRYLLLRSFFDNICHSVPLYLVLGNHDGELGWMSGVSTGSIPSMVANTRKKYFSNPVPGNFYSGDNKSETGIGLRQDYYSWEWGNALFVVLDPFWNSVTKPGWGYTLGLDQYVWFRETLLKSNAKYKFVFAHNLVGGNGNDARGGTEFADLFEMGGYNTDGSWGFDTYRKGWGKPIHQLMKDYNVTVFFHGHDHFYGRQEKDGIIYQEVPQPSNRNITNISASEYGYKDGILLPGRGYLLVTVSDNDIRVDYIGTLLSTEETVSKPNKYIINSYTIN